MRKQPSAGRQTLNRVNGMDRKHLERPFEDHLVRTRRGPNGRSFRYVEGADYVRRLNDAFDCRWSFDVLEHQILEREVIVLCRLEADGLSKVAFGGARITGSQGGRPASLADDLKAAATDALKKASSLLGLGLHLHARSSDKPTTPTLERRAPPNAPSIRSLPTPQKDDATCTHDDRMDTTKRGHERPRSALLTERQRAAIEAIARALGWTADELRQRVIRDFGTPQDKLTRIDASALITNLRRESTGSAA